MVLRSLGAARMARARNIKPGFFTNDKLAECDFVARLLFIGLWTIADCKGRLLDRPKKIRVEVFPYDSFDIEPHLRQLSESGFIRRYTADGKDCIQIENFEKHQNPHKNEVDFGLPGYTPVISSNYAKLPEVPSNSGMNDERLMMNEEPGTMNTPAIAGGCQGDDSFQLSNHPPKPDPLDKDPEPEAKPIYSESFLKWWAIYPRKEAKGEAQKAFDRAVRLIGANSGLTRLEAFNRILEVTRLYADSPAGNRGTMTPMATTWLNQGRYDDDPAQWELTDERKGSNGHAGFSTASQRYSE